MPGDHLSSSSLSAWIDRSRHVVHLSWAMAAGPLLQALAGIVDYAMVGGLGDGPLAAVGLGSFVFVVADTAIAGLSIGLQAEVARTSGAGAPSRFRSGAALIVGVALVAAGLLHVAAPALFALQAASPEVADTATRYFQARNVGLPFLAFALACRGYWFGRSKPQVYVAILATSQVLNVILNWLLIYGNLGFPRSGATGAGWGTAISYAAAALGCLGMTAPTLLGRVERGGPGALREVLQTGVPAAVASVLGLAGMGPILLSILGQIGESAVAAGSVLIQIALIMSLPALGAAFATTSLVAEALGRDAIRDARSWTSHICTLLALTMTPIGLGLALGGRPFMSLFLHDPEALGDAIVALRLLGLCAVPQTAGLVFLHALLTTRYAARSAALSFALVWLGALPLSGFLVSRGEIGLLGLFWVMLAAFLAQTLILGAWWVRGGWVPARLAPVRTSRVHGGEAASRP